MTNYYYGLWSDPVELKVYRNQPTVKGLICLPSDNLLVPLTLIKKEIPGRWKKELFRGLNT